MHLELNWSSSGGLLTSTAICSLSVNCTSVCKQGFIIEVVVFTVRVASFKTSSVVEKALIVHEILICGLSLA
jgi:hypothetical protein